jgi:hypothetical protein
VTIIAACGLLALASAFFVIIPLFTEPRGNIEAELLAETELDRLLNRKAVVYTNLKDLEFEYRMGRLSDADYRRLEGGYKNEAALLLQKLDQLGVEKDLDESLDKEIAARKARLFPAQHGGRVAVCPECGAELAPGKKFCADCGHKL